MNLRALYRGLEALYDADSGVDPVDFLHRLPPGQHRELVLFREQEDGALEIALCLDDATLARVEASPPAQVLADEALHDALPVIEGLSHLLYLIEAARRTRPVSGLELETQAEVDKLALCLLGRWPPPEHDFARLVDRIFCQWRLLPGLGPELDERYSTANRVALGFARRLERPVRAGQLGPLRRALRRFWSADMAGKRALASG